MLPAPSRELLHLRWEHELGVAPLAPPDVNGKLDPDAMERVAAVSLFVQPARAEGVDEFMTKPFRSQERIDILRRLLD